MPEILQLDFMVRAFIAGGVIGVAAPVLGTFLVLRRLALIAEALAHVAITGAAVGLALHQQPVLVAMGVSATAALVMEWLRASNRLSGDSAIALVLYAALAVALVLVSRGGGAGGANLFGLLFGSIVTVSPQDTWAAAAVGAAVLALVWLNYEHLVQTTFDQDLAKVNGVPVAWTNMLLALSTGVMVTLSMRIVGGLLVGALITFPVLASLYLGRGFRPTLLLAAGLGLASVLTGLTFAYYYDVPASGAIVLTALAFLAVAAAAHALAGRLSVRRA
jgi:zinc transport system permease protein